MVIEDADTKLSWARHHTIPTAAALNDDDTDVGATEFVTSLHPPLSPITLTATLDFGNWRTPTRTILSPEKPAA